MSLSNEKTTRRSLLLGTLALSACGYEPIYTRKNLETLSSLRGKVILPNAINEESFALRKQLNRYFGEATDPLYELKIKYSSSSKSLNITQSGTTTRYRITAKGTMKVIRIADNALMNERTFRRVASYSANADRFAADEAQFSTRIRLAETIADDLANHLALVIVRNQSGL